MSEIPIKSVRRVFEILELFDKERRPLAAKEVARSLGYPLASSHALLKSMHALGYTDFYQSSWTYTLGRPLIDVVDWARDFLDHETDILDFVKSLNHETRETVNISRQVHSRVRVLHGLETLFPIGVSVRTGIEMPFAQTLTGHVSMACMEPREADAILDHLKKTDPKQVKGFSYKQLNAIRSELAENGFASGKDFFIKGVGTISMPVRASTTGETLFIGIVGPSNRIKRDELEHQRTLRKLVKEFKIDTLWRVSN